MKVRCKKKVDSAVWRFIGWLAPSLLTDYYTTIGKTIWMPKGQNVVPPRVLAHEMVHVKQWEKWGPLFLIAYLFLPVPFGFAYCRWRFEREAYLLDIKAGLPIDAAVSVLRQYGRPWPARWMRKWFEKKSQ